MRTVSDEKCTALHGVPTHFIGVLEELERLGPASGLDMSSLRCVNATYRALHLVVLEYLVRSHGLIPSIGRTGIAAGSPIPIDLMRQLISKMNLRDLTIAYGMSRLLRLFMLCNWRKVTKDVISPCSSFALTAAETRLVDGEFRF